MMVAAGAGATGCWVALAQERPQEVRDNAIVTTITGQMNLCIVGSRCFLDLLLDDVECVHWKPPEFG